MAIAKSKQRPYPISRDIVHDALVDQDARSHFGRFQRHLWQHQPFQLCADRKGWRNSCARQWGRTILRPDYFVSREFCRPASREMEPPQTGLSSRSRGTRSRHGGIHAEQSRTNLARLSDWQKTKSFHQQIANYPGLRRLNSSIYKLLYPRKRCTNQEAWVLGQKGSGHFVVVLGLRRGV